MDQNPSWEVYVLLTVHSCILPQINPTRCTILSNIFIYFSSLHISGVHVPIIRKKLPHLCDTGICHSVWMASGLLVRLKIQPADRTPPIQIDKYLCRIDTWCGRKVIRLATLCTNRQSCCLPRNMAVRLTPAVDSVQVLTCYSCYAIVESVWSEVLFVRCVT